MGKFLSITGLFTVILSSGLLGCNSDGQLVISQPSQNQGRSSALVQYQQSCAKNWGEGKTLLQIRENCSLFGTASHLLSQFNQNYFSGQLTADQLNFFLHGFSQFSYDSSNESAGSGPCEDSPDTLKLSILSPTQDFYPRSGQLRFFYNLPIPAPSDDEFANDEAGVTFYDANKDGVKGVQNPIPFIVTRASGKTVSMDSVSYSTDENGKLTFYDDQMSAVPLNSIVLDTCSLLNP